MATISAPVTRTAARYAEAGDLIFVGGEVARVLSVRTYRPSEVPSWAPIREGLAARRAVTSIGSRWFGVEPTALPCDETSCLCGGPRG